MKIFKFAFFSLMLATSLLSCKKDSNNNSATGNGTMTAKVDGASFTAGLAVTATITATTPKVCAFAGTGSDGQININLGNYTGPGTYSIGSSSPTNAAIYTLTASPFTAYSANMVLGSGTVTITSDTGGYLEGTFSFSASNNSGGTMVTKNVTDGSFRIKL